MDSKRTRIIAIAAAVAVPSLSRYRRLSSAQEPGARSKSRPWPVADAERVVPKPEEPPIVAADRAAGTRRPKRQAAYEWSR